MSATRRWVLSDEYTDDSWTMPINPDHMSSPLQDRSISTAYGIKTWKVAQGLDRVRSFVTPTPAKEWTWGGPIRTKDHYDQLAYWARKDRKVHVTDHLDRTFEVLMESFKPTDRNPTARTSWRLSYEVTTLVLRRIA